MLSTIHWLACSGVIFQPEAQVETKSPLELFGGFYRTQNGQELTEEQQTYLQNIIESVWED
jgi:exonuclease SbcD